MMPNVDFSVIVQTSRSIARPRNISRTLMRSLFADMFFVCVVLGFAKTILCEDMSTTYKSIINEFANAYGQDHDHTRLKASIASLRGLPYLTALNLIADSSIHEMARYYLIDCLKEILQDQGSKVDSLVELMTKVESPFLREKIAQTLGDVGGGSGDVQILEKVVGNYEKQRIHLWREAGCYQGTETWIGKMKKLPMWNYGQKWMASREEIGQMAGDEAMLLRKIKDNYLILFALRNSLWRVQAENAKRLFENLEDHEKYAYICRNMNNVNRNIRSFILEYMLEHKSRAEPIENMWNPDDVLFSMKYIELIGRTRSKRYAIFLFRKFGKLFQKYDLRENIPREFLSPGASQLIHGWQVAVLALSLEKAVQNIGDIRALIVEYLETHPNYQGKILLLGILHQQTLAARARSPQEDSIDKRVIGFLEDIQTNLSELKAVKNEAGRILRDLK